MPIGCACLTVGPVYLPDTCVLASLSCVPCHAMPCHAMPCHAMPCHAMPCHAMQAMLGFPGHHLMNRWKNVDKIFTLIGTLGQVQCAQRSTALPCCRASTADRPSKPVPFRVVLFGQTLDFASLPPNVQTPQMAAHFAGPDAVAAAAAAAAPEAGEACGSHREVANAPVLGNKYPLLTAEADVAFERGLTDGASRPPGDSTLPPPHSPPFVACRHADTNTPGFAHWHQVKSTVRLLSVGTGTWDIGGSCALCLAS
eukprot:SAG22_NODE_14_length_33165_cov_13.196698_15_plen_255_part_00